MLVNLEINLGRPGKLLVFDLARQIGQRAPRGVLPDGARLRGEIDHQRVVAMVPQLRRLQRPQPERFLQALLEEIGQPGVHVLGHGRPRAAQRQPEQGHCPQYVNPFHQPPQTIPHLPPSFKFGVGTERKAGNERTGIFPVA